MNGWTALSARVADTGCCATVTDGSYGKLPVEYVAQTGLDNVATACVAQALGNLGREVGTGLSAAAIDTADLCVGWTASIQTGRRVLAQQRRGRDVATRVTERKTDGHADHDGSSQDALGPDRIRQKHFASVPVSPQSEQRGSLCVPVVCGRTAPTLAGDRW